MLSMDLCAQRDYMGNRSRDRELDDPINYHKDDSAANLISASSSAA